MIVRCAPGERAEAALEVVFKREGEQIARNVQALSIEPGKFGYRLVRAELEFNDYTTVEAHCRVDMGEATWSLLLPYTDWLATSGELTLLT